MTQPCSATTQPVTPSTASKATGCVGRGSPSRATDAHTAKTRADGARARERKRPKSRPFGSATPQPHGAPGPGLGGGPLGPSGLSSSRARRPAGPADQPWVAEALCRSTQLGDLGIEQLRVHSTRGRSEAWLKLRVGDDVVEARITETASRIEVTLGADADPALIGRIAAALAARGHHVEGAAGNVDADGGGSSGAPLGDFGADAQPQGDNAEHDGGGRAPDGGLLSQSPRPSDSPPLGPRQGPRPLGSPPHGPRPSGPHPLSPRHALPGRSLLRWA